MRTAATPLLLPCWLGPLHLNAKLLPCLPNCAAKQHAAAPVALSWQGATRSAKDWAGVGGNHGGAVCERRACSVQRQQPRWVAAAGSASASSAAPCPAASSGCQPWRLPPPVAAAAARCAARSMRPTRRTPPALHPRLCSHQPAHTGRPRGRGRRHPGADGVGQPRRRLQGTCRGAATPPPCPAPPRAALRRTPVPAARGGHARVRSPALARVCARVCRGSCSFLLGPTSTT